ncbi:S-DNA-T family DNA segregation ATPase FtsK/SpoIIIE [Deinobacterium chartae]|uniref:S-DNA-T family DNA segregation ATPase FtsK/SpoIIIE n=1 Tax=Deinobacterium chartae TaxID=521158 RepID=A0A841HZ35_9DEIO|nr:S-DNA-T family DNA segregation ATPase FtsK/SpoIIIE [Deinobacterium chartae]
MTKRAKPASKSKSPGAPKRAVPNTGRFDGEALGLVLFAVGLLLIASLLEFGGELGNGLRGLLINWLGWGAFLTPLPPLLYGALVFLSHSVRTLTRVTLGAVIIVLAALLGSSILQAYLGGNVIELIGSPLRASLGPAALVLPVVIASLGLEVVLKLPPFRLLRGFSRGVAVAVAAVVGVIASVFQGAQGAAARSNRRSRLRAALEAHRRDLAALAALYPASKELGKWQQEAEEALKGLGGLEDDDMARLEVKISSWSELTAEFTRQSAAELRARLEAEPSGLPETDSAGLAAPVRGRSEAAAALEAVRKSLALDADTLRGSALRLRKEHDAAVKTVVGTPRPSVLEREIARLEERLKAWSDLHTRAEAWLERTAPYTGWPDLIAELEAAPEGLASTPLAAFSQDLAEALRTDAARTLNELPLWRRSLEAAREQARLEALRAPEPAPVIVREVRNTPPATSVPANEPVSGLTAEELRARAETAQPGLFEAVFEIDFEGARLPEVPETPAEEPGTVAVPLPPPLPAQRPVASPPPLPARAAETAPWEDEADNAPQAAPLRPSAVPAPAAPAAQTTPRIVQTAASAHPDRPSQGAIPVTLPDYGLLDPIPHGAVDLRALESGARTRADLINQTLSEFNLQAKVVDYARGPTVTRYEIEPAPGEKISRIAGLSNDLARALAVAGVRVEAPVPGKSVIGLEVPNAEREPVTFHTAAAHPNFRTSRAKLPLILGKSIDGEMMVGDLAKMPHLLIAGSTGSGKSVCVNTLILSLLFKYLPQELRFVMIDPKMVELTPYDGIPHMVSPVVTNPADAAGVLLGAVAHMERRYKMMSQVGAKNLEQYNAKMRQVGDPELPHLVIIIDELADLMITAPKEVESAIMRLAQMARATGMHLVLATQRPSVDILTSLIKVNVPARIAFAVSSSHDSRTILDAVGAERLTGMGDMLFYQPGLVKPLRLQGPYISEAETARITEFLRRQYFDDWFGETYGSDFDGVMDSAPSTKAGGAGMDFSDPYLRQAAEICIEEGQGSVSRLQRRLSVGHARAGKLMDMLEAMGIVTKHQGSKPRDVLITLDQLPEYFGK